MNNRAVFAGTFDPFTLGHYEIVEKASLLFDELIVAVADACEKNTKYSLEKRVEIAKASLQNLSNVKVVEFKGFLVDFMRKNGVKYFVRGLRNATDFEYEKTLLAAYKSQDESVEGYYLMSSNELSYISSSLVRQIIDNGGDASKYLKAEAALLIK